MYGIICRSLIRIGQWAYNYYTAFWLALLTYIVLLTSNIISEGSLYVSFFLTIIAIALLISICLKSRKIHTYLGKKHLKYRFELSSIAVLDGRISDKDSHYNIPGDIIYLPQNWKDQLESEELKVDLIPISKISKKYSMIINPFGSYYIEEDITNLKTLYKIKDYIHWGGVFINTWNLAFWESWNPRDNLKNTTSPSVVSYILDSSPWSIEEANHRFSQIPLKPIISGFSLLNTWLYKNFGVRTTFFEHPISMKMTPAIEFLQNIGEICITEFRSALNSENNQMKFYRLMSARLDKNHECYPVAAINYYLGYLVLFGTAITNNDEFNYECKIIKKLYDKFSKHESF